MSYLPLRAKRVMKCGITIVCMFLAWFGGTTVIAPQGAIQGPPAEYTSSATPGDMVVRDFRFHMGEVLPELHLHYVTWGQPQRNAAGGSLYPPRPFQARH